MPVGCVGPGLDMALTRKLRWAPPHGEARRTTSLSIPNNAWTTIVFNDIDLRGVFISVVNDGFMLGGTPGWWALNFTLAWTSNGTGLRGIQIIRNGNVNDAVVQHTETNPADYLDMQASMDMYVPSGTDYFNAQAIQVSGGGLAVQTPAIINGWDTPLFTATYLGGPPP